MRKEGFLMKKNISWKGSLLIALIIFVIEFLSRPYLGNYILAILEFVWLATLIIGIVGGVRAALNSKTKKTESLKKIDEKAEERDSF